MRERMEWDSTQTAKRSVKSELGEKTSVISKFILG